MSAGKKLFVLPSWFLTLLAFLAGCFVCYITTQFELFKLNFDINVVESLVALATLVVGLYLGITINSRFNNKQHFIHFIEPKLENVWKKAIDLRSLLESNNSIDNTSFSKQIKELNVVVAQLTNVFKIFGRDESCIDDIDNAIDALETRVLAVPVSHNVYDYTQDKTKILSLLDDIDLKIINSINILHNR